MSLGTYTVSFCTSPNGQWGSNETSTERGSFDQQVRLVSVTPTFYASGSGTGFAVVYADDGTLVAKGASQSITAVAGGTVDLPIDVTLDAGVVYMVGFYQTAAATRRGNTDGTNHVSSPAFATFTHADNNLHYASGDTSPTSSLGIELMMDLGLDVPGPTTNVSYFDGSAWKPAVRNVLVGGSWVSHNPQVL